MNKQKHKFLIEVMQLDYDPDTKQYTEFNNSLANFPDWKDGNGVGSALAWKAYKYLEEHYGVMGEIVFTSVAMRAQGRVIANMARDGFIKEFKKNPNLNY